MLEHTLAGTNGASHEDVLAAGFFPEEADGWHGWAGQRACCCCCFAR